MPEDLRCPKCGSETVVRIAKKGPNAGRRFHVCIRYPECKERVAIRKQISDEKLKAYKAKETSDPNLIKLDIIAEDVHIIWHSHNKELNEVWHRTNLQQRDNLVMAFRKELEHEWPKEFSKIQLEKVFHAIEEWLMEGIKTVYLAGYMMGKGWISMDQLSDLTLYLGDNLAAQVRSAFRRAKSRSAFRLVICRGMAFASAFAAVEVHGTLAASETSMRTYEPSKHEIKLEVVCSECGKMNRPDSNFCMNCGHDLTKP